MTEQFSTEVPDLLVRHLEHLKKSALSLEVIKERGYRSVLRCFDNVSGQPYGPGEMSLGALGFKQTQMLLPAILMPIYSPNGQIVLHQLRPDTPRVSQSNDNKPIKYETPARRSLRIDVPPRCASKLGDPAVPLVITEGIKKGDSLAAAGGCAIALMGVWGWKGTNEMGGKTILADLDAIAFNSRPVYIAYDSDITDKPLVKKAMERLAAVLTQRGAIVKIIHLPPGQGGAKTGVDDFLAQGHTLSDVFNLAVAPEAARIKRNIFSELYDFKESFILTNRVDKDGSITPLPLSNFGAKITAVLTRDDGLNQTKFFRIIGRRENGALLPPVEIPVTEFKTLDWVDRYWDVQAIISSHPSAKSQVVQAMKLASQDADMKLVFTHTGWREVNGRLAYLTNGGAIGAPDVMVDLDTDLANYRLPPLESPRDGSGELKPVYREALAASLDFLKMGSNRITLPLWAAMYMAPLNPIIDTCFSMFLAGYSGSYKSSITSLALNHYGAGFRYNRLPGSWNFTDNKLEYLLHCLKDAPLVIDDFAPGADLNRARDLQGKAERVMRDQGNRTGRGRLTKDLVGRVTQIPRGFLITSGEHLPGGMSHNARIYVIEVGNTDIDYERVRAVTAEQRQLYALAMAQYIDWLASQWGELMKDLPGQEMIWYNQAESNGRHPRLPAAVAKLYAGLSMGLQFMVSQGGISKREATSLAAQGFEILLDWSARQGERVQRLSPGNRFLEGLVALINAGKVEFWHTGDTSPRELHPGVSAIGWRDPDDDYLLNPAVAFSTVRSFLSGTDDPLTFSEDAVWRDLKERNMTQVSGTGRNRKNAYIYGRQVWVICLRREAIEHKQNEIQTALPEGAEEPINKS